MDGIGFICPHDTTQDADMDNGWMFGCAVFNCLVGWELEQALVPVTKKEMTLKQNLKAVQSVSEKGKVI